MPDKPCCNAKHQAPRRWRGLMAIFSRALAAGRRGGIAPAERRV